MQISPVGGVSEAATDQLHEVDQHHGQLREVVEQQTGQLREVRLVSSTDDNLPRTVLYTYSGIMHRCLYGQMYV